MGMQLESLVETIASKIGLLKKNHKLKTFLWSTIQEAIPLGSNLQRRGIIQEAKCIRCGELETEAHIFFKCEFAQRVWSLIGILPEIDTDVFSDVASALVAFRTVRCLPPLEVSTNILPWILWVLWTARNVVIFDQRSYTAEETATRGIRLAREWLQAQPPTKISSGQPPHRNSTISRFGQSPQASRETWICHTDAAWDKEAHTAGLAWIIYDPPNATTHRGAQVDRNVISPLAAEALAMRKALHDAISLNATQLRIFSDNQTLIRAINNKLFEKEIYGILKDIESLSSLFVNLSFTFLHRAGNGQADALAKSILKKPTTCTSTAHGLRTPLSDNAFSLNKKKKKKNQKKKKPYVKLNKSSSFKIEIRRKKTKELIDMTLKVADKPGKRTLS